MVGQILSKTLASYILFMAFISFMLGIGFMLLIDTSLLSLPVILFNTYIPCFYLTLFLIGAGLFLTHY
jgi:hypothetical protein